MTFIKSRKHPVKSAPRQHNHAHLAASVVTALALGLPASAMAATAADAYPDQVRPLPQVNVTALTGPEYRSESSSPKFTQPLLDTPQTLQVITSDLFNQQGATTLTEALRNSPGVGTFYAGENGSTSTGDDIHMRGFDASGSIFVDGVRDMGSISRDTFNIQQVEVTKGPDGTEYGRTSPTGAINLVTKQPFLEDAVAGTVALGTDHQRRATADWNLRTGTHSALRLNVMGQDNEVPGRDEVRNRRWGVAPSLAFGLGTPTRVFIDYMYVHQNNTPDGGVSTIGLPGYSTPDPDRPQIGEAPMVDPGNFYGTAQDHDNVRAQMFTARVAHDFSPDMTLLNTTRWGRTRQDYLLTSFMANADRLLTPDLDDPSTWLVERSIPTFKNQENTIVTNQTNLRMQLETGAVEHNLSTGIELTREKIRNTALAARDGSTWAPANLYHPDAHVAGLEYGPTGAWSRGHTDTYAAYLFDAVKFGSQWQVNAGVRLDHYRTRFEDYQVCGVGRRALACGTSPTGSVLPAVDTQVSDNLLNWKLGVVYKPTENGSVYVNYAVSAEPPGGESLQLSARDNSADNPNFDPQKSRTVEAGTKWNLFNENLLLSAAAYRTVVTNQVEQDPVDLLYYQTGEKRVQGVELTAVGQITKNWALNLGVTTMDASVKEGSTVSNDGSRDLAYTPTSAFTAWTSYTFPNKFVIGGGGRYNGSMKRGRDGAIGTPEHVRPYWVFNLMASYPVSRNVSLQLNVYNLFDDDYVASINKSGYRYTPSQPRSAMLTANIRF